TGYLPRPGRAVAPVHSDGIAAPGLGPALVEEASQRLGARRAGDEGGRGGRQNLDGVVSHRSLTRRGRLAADSLIRGVTDPHAEAVGPLAWACAAALVRVRRDDLEGPPVGRGPYDGDRRRRVGRGAVAPVDGGRELGRRGVRVGVAEGRDDAGR